MLIQVNSSQCMNEASCGTFPLGLYVDNEKNTHYFLLVEML